MRRPALYRTSHPHFYNCREYPAWALTGAIRFLNHCQTPAQFIHERIEYRCERCENFRHRRKGHFKSLHHARKECAYWLPVFAYQRPATTTGDPLLRQTGAPSAVAIAPPVTAKTVPNALPLRRVALLPITTGHAADQFRRWRANQCQVRHGNTFKIVVAVICACDPAIEF